MSETDDERANFQIPSLFVSYLQMRGKAMIHSMDPKTLTQNTKTSDSNDASFRFRTDVAHSPKKLSAFLPQVKSGRF